MPSPHSSDSVPSPAADHRRHRLTTFKRTLLGCSALFTVMFCLLAAQMLFGRDPAVGGGAQAQTTAPPTMTASAGGSEGEGEGSWVDLAIGVVQAIADGDDEHADDGEAGSHQGAPLTSRSS